MKYRSIYEDLDSFWPRSIQLLHGLCGGGKYFKLIIKHDFIDINIFLIGLNLLLQYTCPLEAVNIKCLEEIQIYLRNVFFEEKMYTLNTNSCVFMLWADLETLFTLLYVGYLHCIVCRYSIRVCWNMKSILIHTN